MIPVWLLVVFVLGVNFTLWGLVGTLRFVDDRLPRAWIRAGLAGPRRRRAARRSGAAPPAPPGGRVDVGDGLDGDPEQRAVTLDDVAVLMAAHNEEVVIADSLSAITTLVPANQIFIVSDASTDQTVSLARTFDVNVIETATNVGKAHALSEGIRRFGLIERFQAVLLLDADTRLDPGYFTATLPLFDDPAVVAVAGCARSHWRSARTSFTSNLLTAHRSRMYALTQRLIKYGQTWRRVNRTHIVPGFASLYRTSVLRYISITPPAPGLVIEDFNMTFEVYRKRLGHVAFSLKGIAVTQDPDNLRDYIRQTRRWALGLWQTVRKHRLHWDGFSLMLGLLLLELVSASTLFVLLPFVVLLLLVPDLLPQTLTWSVASDTHSFVAHHVSLRTLLIGVLIPDLALTCAVAAVERRPRYLLYGLFFIIIRIIDAWLALTTLPRAWRESSSGRWVSPARREVPGRTKEELAHETTPELSQELTRMTEGSAPKELVREAA